MQLPRWGEPALVLSRSGLCSNRSRRPNVSGNEHTEALEGAAQRALRLLSAATRYPLSRLHRRLEGPYAALSIEDLERELHLAAEQAGYPPGACARRIPP